MGNGENSVGTLTWVSGATAELVSYMIAQICSVESDMLAVLTNSSDGLAGPWATGIIHILRGFARHGSPAPRLRDWTGRWWGLWGALDLLPMGRTVVVATPGFWNPMMDASEISVTAKDRGRITRATGFGSYGEDVRLIRGRNRKVVGLQFGGSRLLPEPEVVVEIKRRHRS